jgi:Tfp pilus assembly protein PilE
MIAVIIVTIIALIIITGNRKEIYRSGMETVQGFPNSIYCIQKKSWSHEWISIFRTQSETEWSDKINEMKNNGKKFIEN